MATLSGAPNVFDNEYDLSQIIPQVATTEAAFVGNFKWGPIGLRRLVGSESQLFQEFHKPDGDNFKDWFSAANFLAYSKGLWVVRAIDTTNANTALRGKNATASSNTGFLVKNDEDYEQNWNDGSLDSVYATGPWIARFPGALGNSLKVSACYSANAYSSVVAGTLTTQLGNKTVTGVGTSFTTALSVGDKIKIDKEFYSVESVANTTSFKLTSAARRTGTFSGTSQFWQFRDEFLTPPTTTSYAADKGGSNDAMHVIVVDEDGSWTGTKGTVLEKFTNVSLASNARTSDGENNYYKDVINQGSRYIHWAAHEADIDNAGFPANTAFIELDHVTTYSLIGGSDGATVDEDEYIYGYDLFRNKEESDVSLIITGARSAVVQQYIIDNICETRRDVVAVLSPPQSAVVNNFGDEVEDIVTYRNTLSSTSYGIFDSGYKYQYDKYNDVYRWVPLNADVAGLMARTDQDRDPWWSPAGFNRGQIKNCIKLGFNPREEERDFMYQNGINSVVTFPGEGTILYGDKTMQTKASAFDRINVRRLFIVLRKAISKAAKYTLFELNDDFTRATFRNMVVPYLRDIAGRRGIYDFKVVCDSTNNTAEVIDRNEFVANILIKPAKSINYVTLNFVATRTGLNFEEVPPAIF